MLKVKEVASWPKGHRDQVSTLNVLIVPTGRTSTRYLELRDRNSGGRIEGRGVLMALDEAGRAMLDAAAAGDDRPVSVPDDMVGGVPECGRVLAVVQAGAGAGASARAEEEKNTGEVLLRLASLSCFHICNVAFARHGHAPPPGRPPRAPNKDADSNGPAARWRRRRSSAGLRRTSLRRPTSRAAPTCNLLRCAS